MSQTPLPQSGLPQCVTCGGALLVYREVFEPDHLTCSMCGRDPGVTPVRFMPDARHMMLNKRPSPHAEGRHQCPTCARYVNIRRRTCINCGDNNPFYQKE